MIRFQGTREFFSPFPFPQPALCVLMPPSLCPSIVPFPLPTPPSYYAHFWPSTSGIHGRLAFFFVSLPSIRLSVLPSWDSPASHPPRPTISGYRSTEKGAPRPKACLCSSIPFPHTSWRPSPCSPPPPAHPYFTFDAHDVCNLTCSDRSNPSYRFPAPLSVNVGSMSRHYVGPGTS